MATGSGGTAPPSSSTLPEMNSGCVREGCVGLFELGMLLLGGLPLPFWAAIVAGKPINTPSASTVRKQEELTPIRTSTKVQMPGQRTEPDDSSGMVISFSPRIRKNSCVLSDTIPKKTGGQQTGLVAQIQWNESYCLVVTTISLKKVLPHGSSVSVGTTSKSR